MSTRLDLTYIDVNDYTYKACIHSRIEDILHKWSLVDANTKLYKIIFINFKGLILILRYNRSWYFITFFDACTKESEVFIIKYKLEVLYCYRRYKAIKERPKNSKVIHHLYNDSVAKYFAYNF